MRSFLSVNLSTAFLGGHWSLKDQRPLSPMGAPQWSVLLVSYTKVKGQVEGAACPEGTRQRPRQHLPGSESLALTCSHPDTLIHIHATHHAHTHTDTLTHRGPGFFDVQGPATPRGTHISVCPGVNRLSNCPVVPTVCTKLKDFRILKFKVTSLSWKPPACGQGPGSYHELLLSEDLPDGRAEAPRETEPRNHKLLKPPKGNFQLGQSQNYGTLSVNEQRKRMRERER